MMATIACKCDPELCDRDGDANECFQDDCAACLAAAGVEVVTLWSPGDPGHPADIIRALIGKQS